MILSADNNISFLSKRILCVLAFGIVIRFIVAGMMTYTYDVHSWSLIISNFQSGNNLYDVAGYNYAPPWGYILGTFSAVAEMFGLSDYGIRSTDFLFVEDYKWFFSAYVPSLDFALAYESMMVIFDVLAGYVIYTMILDRTSDVRKAENGFAFWFLCPFVIVVSCVGGMFDSISALLTCICIYCVMKDRYWLAGMMIGLAASFKLFPGILIFVLAGYALSASEDRRAGSRKVMEAAAGAIIVSLILFMPQILDGTLDECFSFMTSRASSETGSGLSAMERIGTLVFYAALVMASVVLGTMMGRYKGADKKSVLMGLSFANLALLFLYPATPQYVLLLTPFIIMFMLENRRYMVPFKILCVGTTMFVLAATAADLMTLAEFTDVVSRTWVADAIMWTQNGMIGDLCLMDILYYCGGVLQYIGTLSVLIIMYTEVKKRRCDLCAA